MMGWLFLTAPYYVLRNGLRWLLWRRAIKATLIYKSGAKMRIRAQSVKTTRRGGALTSLEFENPLPEAFVFGVDEIAAVYVN